MLITQTGYPLNFIQEEPATYVACHDRTWIFKFFSPKVKLHYIVRAERHSHEFFAIKFYAKKHKRSDRKYNIVINKGDVANILVTCAKAIPYILTDYPNASFGFIGSRTIDPYSNKVEGYANNQRYKLYKYHIPQLIGDQVFVHTAYKKASAYSLINKNVGDTKKYEKKVKSIIVNHYENILDIE
ncbi:hypothetical protein [Autumnicola musiva]|uniref:Uncharacterized protein n=1 Tax=Autumnicola musiva TaxID=3075589 RepID=A0ABU3DBD4_9FLAO|nr:hypothetical protein [Zunongwangia sp. F117]MDT0678833.1 hypothetical protein [Zunongwangia sp. F117]